MEFSFIPFVVPTLQDAIIIPSSSPYPSNQPIAHLPNLPCHLHHLKLSSKLPPCAYPDPYLNHIQRRPNQPNSEIKPSLNLLCFHFSCPSPLTEIHIPFVLFIFLLSERSLWTGTHFKPNRFELSYLDPSTNNQGSPYTPQPYPLRYIRFSLVSNPLIYNWTCSLNLCANHGWTGNRNPIWVT